MDRRKVINKLEKMNGYCECSDLKDLFAQMKKMEILASTCDRMKTEADFDNPRPDDLPYLKDYQKKVELLQKEGIKYNNMLVDYVELGKVIEKEHREYGENIISLHCAKCNQQIDTL